MKALLAVFAGIGYPADDVKATLDRLGEFGLVGSLSRGEPPWQEGDSIRLGVAGDYYPHNLVYNREYLFNIVDDAVLYDANTFTALREAGRNPANTLFEGWRSAYTSSSATCVVVSSMS